MKLVFNSGPEGLALAYVECGTTDEADQFIGWFDAKMKGVAPAAPAPEPAAAPVQTETPPVAHAVPTGGVPAKTKVTRAELSAAAMELMNAKGRASLQAVLSHFDAKRVSEIPDDRMGEALNRIKEVV